MHLICEVQNHSGKLFIYLSATAILTIISSCFFGSEVYHLFLLFPYILSVCSIHYATISVVFSHLPIQRIIENNRVYVKFGALLDELSEKYHVVHHLLSKKIPPKCYERKREGRKRMEIIPGKVIGGDPFNNDEKILPADGEYYEFDIDWSGGGRNRNRLVIDKKNSRGDLRNCRIFATFDHYESFYEIFWIHCSCNLPQRITQFYLKKFYQHVYGPYIDLFHINFADYYPYYISIILSFTRYCYIFGMPVLIMYLMYVIIDTLFF